MLIFKINKDKSNEGFEFMECPIDDGMITIIKPLESTTPMCSVFAKVNLLYKGATGGYVEIGNHLATNYEEAKEIAEKIYKTIYNFNLVTPGKEQ